MGSKKLLSVEETARRIGCSRRTILNAVRTGQLPAVKVGRTYHVSRWGLTEFIGAKTAREVFDDSDLAKMKRAALTARVASLGAKK